MAGGPDGGKDGADSTGATWQHWALGGVVFVLAGVGTFVSQYLSGAYESPDRAVGLVAGSALVGLASALPIVVIPQLSLIQDLLAKIAIEWRWVLAVVVAALLINGAIVGLGPPVGRLTNEWSGCAPSLEFTVVTTPAVRNTADELVDAFEASTAAANDGCPTAHGFVYNLPEDTITNAIKRGWVTAPDRTFLPRRDLGPRPDVWLTESTLPLDVLNDSSQPTGLVTHSFGRSPVVLAVPPRTPLPEGNWLPELVAPVSTSIGVVRPDPRESTAGLLATAALYGADVDTAPSGAAPAVASEQVVEQQLGAAASARAFSDGDEGALLCRFRRLTDSLPALLLSEQAVRRYNEGRLVGGPCPGDPPSGAALTPVYAQGPGLDHQVVRFDWPESPAPPRAAADFEDWLLSADGQDAVDATGLRPATAVDPTSVSLAARSDLSQEAVAEVRRRYLEASRPRRELLALDFSGSMNDPGLSPGRSRADVVRQAVADAACAIRQKDEIGLWTFPGDSDRRPRPVVPTAKNACGAVAAAAALLVPRGNTPLLQTIVDGVTTLRATDNGAERRLVVVTDGRDTSSDVRRADVLNALSGAQVKVFVVTLGDVTCDTDPLQAVADASGGRCYDPGSTVDQIREALGG